MKKSVKIVLVIVAFPVMAILAVNLLFGLLIKTQLKKFTGESITLEYKSSNARLLIGSIEFNEATLLFKDVSIDSNSSIFIKNISFEKFALTHLSLNDLLFNRSFNIENVLLSGPSIEFLKDTAIRPKDIFSKILTPKVLSTKVKSTPFSFDVGELEIEQGSFNLTEDAESDFSLGSVNLKLTDISMEDLRQLNSEDPDLNAQFNIRLSVFNIQKKIDENSSFTIDSVVYKKNKREIDIGGIKVNGIKTASNFAESELHISTDLISINGFSLSHLLSTSDLKFNKLTVSSPDILEKIKYFDEKKKGTEKAESKVQFLSSVIDAFITDTFYIENANYYSLNLANDLADFVEGLNLQVFSVRIDSNFIFQKEFLNRIEKSSIQCGPINMHVPELGFDFSCDTMIYFGPGKEQTFVNLQLTKYPPLFSENTDQSKIRFNADSLFISGLDEKELVDSAIIEISIHIKNPTIFGTNVNLGKPNSPKPKAWVIDKILLNDLNLLNGQVYIEGTKSEVIDIGSLHVEATDLEIFSGNHKSKKTVEWRNIISTIEKSKFLVPNKMEVQVNKGTINDNNFEIDGVFFSEIRKVGQYGATSKKLPDTTRIFTEKIQIENFDLGSFINGKDLHIDKLEISKPTFYQYAALKHKTTTALDSISPLILYKRINKILPTYFSSINIRDFLVNGAKVNYIFEKGNLIFNTNYSIQVQNILFNHTRPEGKAPELVIDKYKFCLTDLELYSDKVQFISESVCYENQENILSFINSHANNLRIKNHGNSSFPMSFTFLLPKIELTNPDFNPTSGGPFSFEEINIIDPHINIHFQVQEKNGQDEKKSPPLLPFTFIEDAIHLSNGKIDVSIEGPADSTIFKIGKIDIVTKEMGKIIGVAGQHSENRNMFNYLDFTLNDIGLAGIGMSLEIDNINYNNEEGIISATPVRQKMFSEPGMPLYSNSINIPSIIIKDPNVMLVDERIQSYGAAKLLVPDMEININTTEKKETNKDKKARIIVNDSSLRNLLGKADFFHIDTIAFNNIGFSHRALSDSTGGSFDIERISFIVDELKVDPSHFDIHGKRIAKDIILKLHDKEVVSGDSLYLFKVGDVTYYYSRDKVVIDSCAVIPRYEREGFFEKVGMQTDRMQIEFNSAVFEGIDLLSIIESKKLQIRKFTLNDLRLLDHRDKRYARKENDFKKLPKQMLFDLPFPLNIDTVQVNNSYFLYGEYIDKSPKPGEVYFTNFDASIYNISNIASTENKPDSIFAHITTDIMDVSPMNIDLTIPLEKNDDRFWLKGNVEKVDLTEFSSMTENLFGISVLRGKGGVDIPLITFDENNSTGSIIFEYKKLKLALYNRNKAKINRGLGSGLIDFMLNGVLVKSNNPTFLGKTRIGDVYAERNNERSFFNYTWKSTMSGLMSTMGFNNKELREEIKGQKEEEKIERKDERQTNK